MLLNVWTKHTQTNSVHVTNIKRLILVWFWFDFYLNFSPLRRYPPVCMRVACCYCYCVCEIATASYEQPWQQLQHLQQRWSDWKLQLGWLTKTTKTTTTTRRCNAPALPFQWKDQECQLSVSLLLFQHFIRLLSVDFCKGSSFWPTYCVKTAAWVEIVSYISLITLVGRIWKVEVG